MDVGSSILLTKEGLRDKNERFLSGGDTSLTLSLLLEMIKTGPRSEKQVRQFLFLKEMKITPKGARAYTHTRLEGGNIQERKRVL